MNRFSCDESILMYRVDVPVAPAQTAAAASAEDARGRHSGLALLHRGRPGASVARRTATPLLFRGQHHDLSCDDIVLHQFLGLGEFAKRHHAVDDRFYVALLDEPHRLDKLALVAQM